MESIKEIYKIGNGPSSSHTMGPLFASNEFLHKLENKFKEDLDNINIDVVLYSSLAWTGKGHLTDTVLKNNLKKYNPNIIFDYKTETEHPNTLTFKAYKNNKILFEETYISIGGGYIKLLGAKQEKLKQVYSENTFEELSKYINENKIDVVKDYVDKKEENLNEYLNLVVDKMIESVENGLKNKGYVAFELKVKRVSSDILLEAKKTKDLSIKRNLLLTSYAYATSEENSAGGVIVTAPTAGSCGVLASLVYYYIKDLNYSKNKVIDALKVAGLIGLIIKNEATISGSVGGCQAEIGSASSMGAAFCAYLNNLNIDQIGYAAEVSLEHSLGLTCDPVNGYVAIPCIERNGIGSLRAYDAYLYAKHISKYRKAYVSFDNVCKVMLETGQKMNSDLKETSRGGLAKIGKKEYE